MVPYQTPIIAEKDWSFLWRKELPWQRESLAKTPHILALAAHIPKADSITLIFYFWNVISMQEWNFLQS